MGPERAHATKGIQMWVMLGREHLNKNKHERGSVGLFLDEKTKKMQRYGRWATLAFSIFEHESEGGQQTALEDGFVNG
jgi:hypothetical protein